MSSDREELIRRLDWRFLFTERDAWIRRAERYGPLSHWPNMHVAWNYHRDGIAAGGAEDPEITAKFTAWRLTG